MQKKNSKLIRYLKIIFSAIFVCAVGFFAARFFLVKPSSVTPEYAKTPAVVTPKRIVFDKEKPAKLAIVLDDWGNNYSLLEDAVKIGEPLTLAIIPNLKYSQKIAQEAYEAGLGVMIHMPMQPKSTKQNLEPHTIRVNSSDEEIVRYLEEAVRGVPHASGMNNHMGSAATSDKRVMDTVLKFLKQKKLFFVDSHVIAGTVCEPIARKYGVLFGKRSVFIDNEVKVPSIQRQIREAIRLAKARGELIAIGHDKKATLDAIRLMLPEIQKSGVKLVLAEELVR